LAVPKSWPLSQQKSIKITEIEGMPFINRTPCEALDKLKATMANSAVRFQPRANIKTIEYAWQLVCAGIGAALLPDWQEILEAEELSLIPIDNSNLVKDIGLAFRSNKENSELMKAIIEICRTSADIS
jgi:DNA-binding transcriptional LysR family regulator